MKTGNIHQVIAFRANPEEVYELLMNEQLHSEFSGSAVEMSRDINGRFTVFDDYCTGYNIELEPGKKIVQAWHFREDGWPEDHYSTCTFLFEKTPDGCLLDFTQTGIPVHKTEALTEGWEEYYWQPMKEFLGAG